MRSTIAKILIAISLVLALAIGMSLVRAILFISYVAPGEHTFIQVAPTGLLRPLLVSLSPIGLYAASFVLDRRVGWSRFGKLGFTVQIAYGLLLIGSSFYAYHLVHALDRTA